MTTLGKFRELIRENKIKFETLSTTKEHLENLEKRCQEGINEYQKLKTEIEIKEQKLKEKENATINIFNARESQLQNQEEALKKIYSEKAKGFPWLAETIAEYYKFIEFEVADYLENKSHPAFKKAEEVREVALNNRILRKQLKIAENFVHYYESLFPWITDYVGDDLDDLLEYVVEEKVNGGFDETEPALQFIPHAEFESLPEEVRYQKALDRYLASRKKPWQIGRDYERYIGYLYERSGFKVEYMGIEKGLEDLGRDLICTRGNKVEIVQCKYWANYKTIHEKHINQLYGTAVQYYIEHKSIIDKQRNLVLFPELIHSGEIRATFITSTKLSETAKEFAEALGIQVIQEKPLNRYPMIKCNIASNGEKIFHLPFDQQYDRTLIINKGEFYAMTVKEAMDRGFRRAFRWRGNQNQDGNKT